MHQLNLQNHINKMPHYFTVSVSKVSLKSLTKWILGTVLVWDLLFYVKTPLSTNEGMYYSHSIYSDHLCCSCYIQNNIALCDVAT